MNIKEKYIDKKYQRPIKVIQFGEGNFMRAFVDWQIEQMNQKADFNGNVAIIQPIDKGMVANLNEQNCLYTLLLEGILNDEEVQSAELITSIQQAINPYQSFDEFKQLACLDTLELIFSNTTEAGIAFDNTCKLTDCPASSFPAKLTQFLYFRFQSGKNGLYIIPCELINYNGQKLKRYVLDYAELWRLPLEFTKWIEEKNYFYSTLVDRIVPGFPRENKDEVFARIGYEDNLLVKAEPFHLFVIEGNRKLEEVLPFKKAGLNIVLTDNMQPYRERKVRLLNGPHTTMTPIGLLAGFDTVGQVMKDNEFLKFINDEMYEEIAPVIDLPYEELAAYTESVKERFANPFVEHKLNSIALNSISKFRTRLLPTLLAQLEQGKLPKRIILALASLLIIYSGKTKVVVQDTDEVIELFEKSYSEDIAEYVNNILSATQLWEEDLSTYPDLTAEVIDDIQKIEKFGVYQSMKDINEGK